MGETSKSIRKRVQAARNIQQQRFASSQSDIICNADMRVGEIRQFCKLQDEGKFDAGSDDTAQFVGACLSSYLAEALHASQSSEVNDGVSCKL
jgi:predicted ATPase with chaperone activity